MPLLQVKLTRDEKRRIERIARISKSPQAMIVRQWIALDERGDRNATPSDGLTRGETGANVPTTTRGE